MLRWLLLTATFAIWVASIVVIYQNYGPRETRESMPGTANNLEALFMENAEPVRAWAIFIDPRNLQGASTTAAPWNGVNEKELLRIGWIETVLKRKDFTRVEQTTEILVEFPAELKSEFLEKLGKISYRSRSDVSMDQGLESFSSNFSIGIGFDARSIGFRQNDELVVTSQLWHQDKEMMNQRNHFPAGNRGTPSVELIPFGPNPNIRVGEDWDLALLDTSVDLNASLQPKVVAHKARCTRRTKVEFQKEEVAALEVEAGDGALRAWYSPDGVVYKQVFKFANMFDVILVREEFKAHQKNRLRQAIRSTAPLEKN